MTTAALSTYAVLQVLLVGVLFSGVRAVRMRFVRQG
jgi:hypothetical protein